MPKVKQLDWSKLQPPQKHKRAMAIGLTKLQAKHASQSQAKKYVDMLFQKKITEMMDRDV